MGNKSHAGAMGTAESVFSLPAETGQDAVSSVNIPSRIVVLDERRLCREGLKLLIRSLDPSLDVFEAKSAGDMGTARDADGTPVIAVYTLIDRGENPLDGLRRMIETYPDVRAIVLCDHADRALAQSVMVAGAKAFLPSTTPSPVLAAVLRLVAAGGLYVPPPVLFDGAGAGAPQVRGAVPREVREAAIRDAFHQLTARQRSVLALLSEGCTNRTVAETLDMRENTVKAHVKQIMHKLHVDNRTQAALMADRLITHYA